MLAETLLLHTRSMAQTQGCHHPNSPLPQPRHINLEKRPSSAHHDINSSSPNHNGTTSYTSPTTRNSISPNLSTNARNNAANCELSSHPPSAHLTIPRKKTDSKLKPSASAPSPPSAKMNPQQPLAHHPASSPAQTSQSQAESVLTTPSPPTPHQRPPLSAMPRSSFPQIPGSKRPENSRNMLTTTSAR